MWTKLSEGSSRSWESFLDVIPGKRSQTGTVGKIEVEIVWRVCGAAKGRYGFTTVSRDYNSVLPYKFRVSERERILSFSLNEDENGNTFLEVF